MADEKMISEIKELVEQINYAATQLDQRLLWLGKEIRLKLSSLEGCKSVADAQNIFDSLSEYQYLLSTIAFKHNYPLPNELRGFVKRFERLDDDDLRNEILKMAKAGQFRS